MKSSYNTKAPLTSHIPSHIPWFNEWQEAFNKAHLQLLKRLCLDQCKELIANHMISEAQYKALDTEISSIADTHTPKSKDKLKELLGTLEKLTSDEFRHKKKFISISTAPKEVAAWAFRTAADEPQKVSPFWLEQFNLDDTESNRLRLCDPVWISRKFKKEWRLIESRFNHLLSSTALPFTAITWVSNLAKQHYKKEVEMTANFSKNFSIQNRKTGEIVEGSKVFDAAKADEHMYSEHIAVVAGISELAAEQGCSTAALITITFPSEFHQLKTCKDTRKRIPNPKWNGMYPDEIHRYFQTQWRRIRANLADKGQSINHYVRAAQPHKSGVPHYHLTVFTESEQHLIEITSQIAKQLNQNWMITRGKNSFITEDGITSRDPQIRGIRTDLFLDKKGNTDPMGALNYIIAGLKYMLPDEQHSGSKRSLEEVHSIKNWARKNNIRRFTSSHGHRTLWRKLRAAKDFFSTAQMYAKANDYANFYRSLHIEKEGVVIKEGIEHFQTITTIQANQYNELVEVPTSIFMINKVNGLTHTLDISSQWEIFRKIELTVTDKDQEAPNPMQLFPTFKDGKWQLLFKNGQPPPWQQ